MGWSCLRHWTVNDQLWIGVRQTGSWNNDEGTIVRWNMTNESWEDDLATIEMFCELMLDS